MKQYSTFIYTFMQAEYQVEAEFTTDESFGNDAQEWELHNITVTHLFDDNQADIYEEFKGVFIFDRISMGQKSVASDIEAEAYDKMEEV